MIHFERASTEDVICKLSKHLNGAHLLAVERREDDWMFGFSGGLKLAAFGPWRVLHEGKIGLGFEDDGQLFGFSTPVKGNALTLELLGQYTVSDLSVREITADLFIAFGAGATLEIFNISMGYEGWHASTRDFEIVAQGGGQLAVWTASNLAKPR